MPRFCMAAALVCCLSASSIAFAQTVGASPPTRDETPRDRVVRIFDEVSPALGEPLPDVTIYDARGAQFALRDLRGHYSVLLFGCLT